MKRIKKLLIFWGWLFWDPALLILWMRNEEDVYNGIPKKRIGIFFISCFLSTLVWVMGFAGIYTLWLFIKN